MGRIKNSNKKDSRSTNLYTHLLIKLFRFLSRRTDSAFCKTVLRRLIASRRNRPPISLSKMTVAALRFTETARARITKAGGKCMTIDELIMTAPTGTNTLLLRASKDREAKKHFGPAPGVPGSHTKPWVRSKGRKFEKAKSI